MLNINITMEELKRYMTVMTPRRAVGDRNGKV